MKLLTLICILSTLTFAQSQYPINPDGYVGYLSIHFTPMFESGEADYIVGSETIGSIEYPSRFNFQVELKLPLSTALTLSAFYHYRNNDSDFSSDIYLSDKVKGSLHSFGGTISLYIGSPN